MTTQLEQHFATQSQMLDLCRALDRVKLKEFVESIDEAQQSACLERGALERVCAIKRLAQTLLLAQEAHGDLRSQTRTALFEARA